jgi:hypothetical protein
VLKGGMVASWSAPLTVDQLKTIVRWWNCSSLGPTEPCFICGKNEWRYSSSMVIDGSLYVALSCAMCPTSGGPLIGPYQLP